MTVTVHASSNAVTPEAVGGASVTVVNPLPITVEISHACERAHEDHHAVHGDRDQHFDNSITWKVNGLTGGNATVGTVSTSGLYKAPITVPSPSKITVTAISAAHTTKSTNAAVTVTRR